MARRHTTKDKRPDFVRAYEVAAREARLKGADDEAAILEGKANALRFHMVNHPVLAVEPA
jgi:hypothetical protein